MQSTVEVSLSPLLYPYKISQSDHITVVVDIFRATTSMVSALNYGVKSIIPVKGVDEAKKMKENGYLVACERDGKLLDFADIGNSPSDFWLEPLKNKTLAFSTTNGTQAVNIAKESSKKVLVGAFINLQSLVSHLLLSTPNVVILCAGWKNLFNLEDTLFAGALAKNLIDAGYITYCDATKAAMHLWQDAHKDIKAYLAGSSHRQRLSHILSQQDFEYSITLNSCEVVPILHDNQLIKS